MDLEFVIVVKSCDNSMNEYVGYHSLVPGTQMLAVQYQQAPQRELGMGEIISLKMLNT